jgi:retinol dehydrogenase-12
MPDMRGKTCLVTGANAGLGKKIAEGLAVRGATVVLICRSRERGQAALSDIEKRAPVADLHLRLADLAKLDDVRSLGPELHNELERIDVLVNNAGTYRARREITPQDGFEKTMAVNHLAHFLLTHLLLKRLLAANGRVITVTSAAHRAASLRRAPLESILRGASDYNGFRAYADSKAANILFTSELARRYGDHGLTAVAVHPGAVATGIWTQNGNPASLFMRLLKPIMRSPASGARPVLRLAAEPQVQRIQGRYFLRMEQAEPHLDARDPALARELWDLSERLSQRSG